MKLVRHRPTHSPIVQLKLTFDRRMRNFSPPPNIIKSDPFFLYYMKKKVKKLKIQMPWPTLVFNCEKEKKINYI